jgi:hypothetical protein
VSYVLNFIIYTHVFINFCELHIHDKKSISLVVGYILFYTCENSFDLGSDGTVGSQSVTDVYVLYLMYYCLLPLVLQPAVGFGLSNNTSPFVPVYHQLSPTWCITVKNKLGWSAGVFYMYKIILLFSVVFCLVGTVHKFDCRLVANWSPDRWHPVGSDSRSEQDWGFSQELYVFFARLACR